MFGFSYSLDNITICQVVGNGFDPSSLRALGSTGLVSSLAGLSWSGSLGPVESIPWGWGSVLPSLPGPVPHNLGVDGAGDTVVQLGIKLGQSVGGVHRSLRNIPDGSSLYDVPDSLILRAGLRAVCAPDVLDVSTSMFVTSSVTPLERHFLSCRSESSNI